MTEAPQEVLADDEPGDDDDLIPDIPAVEDYDGSDDGDDSIQENGHEELVERLDKLGMILPETVNPAMQASASGLSAPHRANVRNDGLRTCRILFERQPSIHYTQGASRWNAIARNQSPWEVSIGDCSSIAAYIIRHALWPYTHRDLVNGLNWHGGYTGTMLNHGKTVVHESSLKVLDCIIFGSPGSSGRHVIVYTGGGYALSHGSERGPIKVPIHYRSDIESKRRYI